MQPPIRPNDQPSRTGSGPVPPVGKPGARQPGEANPFEDTGYAPELRAARSENLYRRDERFWQHMPGLDETLHGRPRHDGYFDHPEQFHKTRSHKPPRGRRGSHVIALVLGVAVLLMAVTILFASPLFSVQEIRVAGNSRVSAEEIISRSGLTIGMNRFSLNADQVMNRVEGNHYLICELVHMPEWNTVEIRVREREVVAVIDYNGLMYFADNRGMILEEFSNRSSIAMADKILVVGLDIRRCDVGRTVTLSDVGQLDVYNEILVELKVMGGLDMIEELDMSTMESIFLTTRDGYSVRLGNGTEIHQKLRSMLLTLDALRKGGYGVGSIDVSAPINPTFVPEEGPQSEGA